MRTQKGILVFSALLLVSLLFMSSCASKKTVSKEAVFNGNWELEYLSGPGVALLPLFNKELPFLQFDKEDQRVFGSTGCNGYTAGFQIEGYNLQFGTPGPSTLMYCGEGEELFKQAMSEVTTYSLSADGKLYLMKGEIPLMRFKKSDKL